MSALRLVHVEKDGDLRTHIGKPGIVRWTGGQETTATLPACGTRVDVAATYPYDCTLVEVTCGRCQRTNAFREAQA